MKASKSPYLFLFLCLFSLSARALDESPVPIKPTEFRVGERVPDVDFVDIDGRKGKLSDYRTYKAIVIAFNLIDCPLCRKWIGRLEEIKKTYQDKNVAFLMLNVGKHNIDILKDGIKELGITYRYLPDTDRVFSRELLGLTSTEVFVLDQAQTLMYRGPVDDQFGLTYSIPEPRNNFLKNALSAVLDGAPIEEKAFSAPGCALKLPKPSADRKPTFHNRISRLVQTNCQSCHRKGEGAPFAFSTPDDLLDRAPTIRAVVEKGLMPPWYANPQFGKFKNDASLTARDKQALFDWLDQDGPEGDKSEAAVPVNWPSGWSLGKPDVEITIPKAIAVPASGVMPYQYVLVKTDFTEDKWVKGFEIRVTQPQVVHHVLILTKDSDGLNSFIAARVPGSSAIMFPKGVMKKIAKGTELYFQLHYTPNGVAVEDKPTVGLFFSTTPPEHIVSSASAYNTKFEIPPEDPNYVVEATHEFKKRTRLLHFMPHMHLRGKSFKYELVKPDGTKQVLLDVPRYNFNWQLMYKLAVPIDVEKGDVLKCTAVYDNSSKNPANPNPKIAVKWGEQTFEEMMVGYFDSYELE